MPENVCIPFYETSDITVQASAAVTGKRFVAPSANRTGGPGLSTSATNVYVVAHAPAGAKPAGVSVYDAPSGGLLGIIGTPGRIVPVTAGAAITAGQQVEVGTAGQAIPLATGQRAGLAMTGAASGAAAEIKLS
jgi:hypothetical protein